MHSRPGRVGSLTPVRIPLSEFNLEGDLGVPPDPRGLVLFAHGSGSSRHSPRNQYVARRLEAAGLATLLVDLLTPEEDARDIHTAEVRFDMPLLASRLVAIVDWLAEQPSMAAWPIGLFGASTGGGAALVASAERPGRIRAVVSRGGRPDLAGAALSRVAAPTLLIVGSYDEVVLDLNRHAIERLRSPTALHVVPGASHLFEEPGALDEVATQAAAWFATHLS